MSENKKLELLDQYDDVTFALLMDEYAEEEGARLRKEFEEAQAAGEVSDTSDALDEKCLQIIRRDFAKKRGKENVRKIIRMTSKVAVAVMVFFGVAATTIMSVDAFRIPVLNFIVEHFDEYSAFDNSDEYQYVVATDPLAELLPEEFEKVYHSVSSAGYIASCYATPDGNLFELTSCAHDSSGAVDSEDTHKTEIVLAGIEAQLFVSDNLRVVWLSSDGSTIYDVRATGLEMDTFVQLCADLVSTFEGNGV